jgi:hypothetical protein
VNGKAQIVWHGAELAALVRTLMSMESQMALLLLTVERLAYVRGYAPREWVLQIMRERLEQRFVDADTRSLIARALSADLIAEIRMHCYVCTRRGERELSAYLHHAEAA